MPKNKKPDKKFKSNDRDLYGAQALDELAAQAQELKMGY